MTDDTTLFDRWQENKDRPAWVQANRDALMEATGKHVPRARDRIDEWLDDHKGAVTQKLQPEDDEEDSDGGGESGGEEADN